MQKTCGLVYGICDLAMNNTHERQSCDSLKWEALSVMEKRRELFRRQKELLDTFLSTGAISQAQHDKSLSCLIEKMGMQDE